MINFETIVISNNYVYTQLEREKFLVKISLTDGSMTVIDYLPSAQIRSGCVYHGNIYLADSNSSQLLLIENDILQYKKKISLNNYFSRKYTYLKVYTVGKKLLVFPLKEKFYFVVDEGNVCRHNFENDRYLVSIIGVENEKAYLLLGKKETEYLCELNDNCELRQIGNSRKKILDVKRCIHDGEMYELTDNGIEKINLKIGERNKVNINNINGKICNKKISMMIVTKTNMVFFPTADLDDVLIYDRRSDIIEEYKDEENQSLQYSKYLPELSKFGEIAEYENSLLVAPRRANKLIILDEINENIHSKVLSNQSEYFKAIKEYMLVNKKTVFYEGQMNLKEYLKTVI